MLQTNLDENSNIQIKPLGDSAILVQFGSVINREVHLKVKAFTDEMEAHSFAGFIECVPAFTSVTIFYNPVHVYEKYKKQGEYVHLSEKEQSPYSIVYSIIKEKLKELKEVKEVKHRVVDIPVCYGGEFGPDLEAVAEYHHLSAMEVIQIHSKSEYLVYIIGFAPGFPYLGGMSEKIATPRHHSPRLSIPSGSVGIAGMQTGVYPISTPGGWQIIGRTPVDLFYPKENPPSLLRSGDIVKFKPISLEEYKRHKEKIL
ncbi:5-oxoprolinase subunit PxpB [Shimazuella kribbensis]|uniref:5-oxoprolinase subunit PxpB n=1 Tax=Shimazuella kribbensis TaxID=139808 RepID=UPI0003F5D32E|nr:5-oxoprolinase subunit PxpB [Shimazuella kribbensis]